MLLFLLDFAYRQCNLWIRKVEKWRSGFWQLFFFSFWLHFSHNSFLCRFWFLLTKLFIELNWHERFASISNWIMSNNFKLIVETFSCAEEQPKMLVICYWTGHKRMSVFVYSNCYQPIVASHHTNGLQIHSTVNGYLKEIHSNSSEKLSKTF